MEDPTILCTPSNLSAISCLGSLEGVNHGKSSPHTTFPSWKPSQVMLLWVAVVISMTAA